MRLSVVSPHLDDAVLSVAALIHDRAAHGWDVKVVTVFGNDPRSDDPPSPWEASAGFKNSGHAARTRRDEDAVACRSLGCAQSVLPLPDEEHRDGAAGAQLWSALHHELADSDVVLAPGYPLRHPDHELVAAAVWQARGALAGVVGFYVEQPYASSVVYGRSRRVGHSKPLARGVLDMGSLVARRVATQPVLTPPLPPFVEQRSAGLQWRSYAYGRLTLRTKWRAIAQYRSQLRGLGPLVRTRISLYEIAAGGEMVCLPEGARGW